MVYPNKDTYEGEFLGGNPVGRGIFKYKYSQSSPERLEWLGLLLLTGMAILEWRGIKWLN
jgi:hypothetical protein